MGITITIVALIIGGGLLGALAFGAPYAGIPLVLLFIGGVITLEFLKRQNQILRMKRFRREAQARPVGFDSGDKKTLV